MIYGTGGGVFADTSGNLAIGFVSTDGTRTASFRGSGGTTRTGWTLGGGLEYKLDQQWSVKLEDLFMNAGNLSAPGNCVDTVNGAVCRNFTNVTFNSASGAGNFNVIRIGVNYKFF
jgi:outer membrane immunogenic protein